MQHIKDLLFKKQELLTDDERAKVDAHAREYLDKVRALSKEYGLELAAVLRTTPNAIAAALDVRVVMDTEAPEQSDEEVQVEEESKEQ